MHFYNAKHSANFIQRVLERSEKAIIQLVHRPTEKKLHVELIQKLENGKTRTHHIKFTKEHLHYFGRIFPKWEGEEGESINKEIIDQLPEDSIVYFVMKTEIYKITRKEIIEYDCQWLIKNVRPVYSVPLSALTPFYQEGDWHIDGLWEFG